MTASDIEVEILHFCSNLSFKDDYQSIIPTNIGWCPIRVEDAYELERPFIEEEAFSVVSSLGGSKSHNPTVFLKNF